MEEKMTSGIRRQRIIRPADYTFSELLRSACGLFGDDHTAFVSGEDNGITVVLDTNLTPELIEEGFVRELISKVQTMRKDAGFEVMDRIRVFAQGNEKIAQILERFSGTIGKDVLADAIDTGKMAGYEKDWNINGEHVTLGVEKIS